MGLLKKISEAKYNRKKRKEEKEQAKYNQRQEEYDSVYRQKKQKHDFKSLLARLKFETYTKRLVFIIVCISIIDLQLSYVLAFLDKEQIAETLSNQICVTILGTVTVYMIRAYFDTKAEKKDEMIKSGLIVDKNKSIIPDEVIKAKIQEVIDNTGLSQYINSEESDSEFETENPDDINYE